MLLDATLVRLILLPALVKLVRRAHLVGPAHPAPRRFDEPFSEEATVPGEHAPQTSCTCAVGAAGSRRAALRGSARDAVLQMHEAALEAALADQLEIGAQAVRQRALAAPDDDRREEQVALVDQPGAQCLRREIRAADARSCGADCFMRRTASGSNSRSRRVRGVGTTASVRE